MRSLVAMVGVGFLVGCGPSGRPPSTSGAASGATSQRPSTGASTGQASGTGSGTVTSGGTPSSGSASSSASASGSTTGASSVGGNSTGATGQSGNCDGKPYAALCSTNLGATDLSKTCFDGLCDWVQCGPSAMNQGCVLGGAAGICCGQTCAVGSDQNCGGCGFECPQGSGCTNGQCSADCASPTACPTGTSCATLGLFPAYCGASLCAGLPDQTHCALGSTEASCCGQTCTDTRSDSQNCGACAAACGQGSVCSAGSCVAALDCATAAAGSACQLADGSGGQCCGGCQPLSYFQQDTSCAVCGAVCPQGAHCSNGLACSASCSQAGEACPAGSACGLAGKACQTETCAPNQDNVPCATGVFSGAQTYCCHSSCADLSQDSNNCGLCGNACGAGAFCQNGSCVAFAGCPAGSSGASCPLSAGSTGLCCAGSCVDPTTSAQSCGACGAICPANGTCTASACSLSDAGTALCAFGSASGCPAGTLCTGGNTCVSTSCAAGDGLSCAFGDTLQGGTGVCCGGACVLLSQDPANCGGCGQACGSNVCLPTSAGSGPAAGACLAPQPTSDCTLSCGNGSFCLNGQCWLSSCASSGPQPSGSPCQVSSGSVGACCAAAGLSGPLNCEDLFNDPKNCGACGAACPAGQACSQGACAGTVAPCGPGHENQFCNLDGGTSFLCCGGGDCTNLSSDPQHCGTCGAACAAGDACVGGACIAGSCSAANQGQSCSPASDGKAGTCCATACVDESTDPQNCGSCGQACAAGQTCEGGHCGVGTCTSSDQGVPCHRGLAGQLPGTCCQASCVDLSSDPSDCGACGTACVSPAVCSSSICQ